MTTATRTHAVLLCLLGGGPVHKAALAVTRNALANRYNVHEGGFVFHRLLEYRNEKLF